MPSHVNPADSPFRFLSDLDAKLSLQAWAQVEHIFGPHSIDLMALPENVQCNPARHPLRFFSPRPRWQSTGTNVFAQDIASHENAYVFPPSVLIGPLLRYLSSQNVTFTIIVPDLCPRKYWWPILTGNAIASFRLGQQGDKSVLLFPSKSGPSPWELRPLQ